MSATKGRIPPVLSPSDIDVSVDEPRVKDTRLGERLGMARPRVVREMIDRNRDELETYGSLAVRRGKSRGQAYTEYWLNEGQALLICMFSRTERAAAVRKEVIDVFMAFRRGEVPVRAHTRRKPQRAPAAPGTDALVEDLLRRAHAPLVHLLAARGPDAHADRVGVVCIDGEVWAVDLDDVAVAENDTVLLLRTGGRGAVTVCPAGKVGVGSRGRLLPMHGPAGDTFWDARVLGRVYSGATNPTPIPHGGASAAEPQTPSTTWRDPQAVADLLIGMRFRRDEMFQPALITPAQAEALHRQGRLGPRQWARLEKHIRRTGR